MYRVSRFGKRRAITRNKKAPTGAKAPYIIFNPHTLPPLQPSHTLKPGWHAIVVTTIDPGIVNCAVRQAVYCLETRRVGTNMQILINFTHESFQRTTVTIPGNVIPEAVGIDTQYYINAMKALDEFMPQFRWCHYIVIESQLPINYDLVRMSQHITTYLMQGVKDQGFRPLIIEIDPHLKSRMLGAPRLKKPQLKVWCRDKAIEILTARGDVETARLIERSSKDDDHGDTVCYEAIWLMILQGDLHTPPVPEGTRPLMRDGDSPLTQTLEYARALLQTLTQPSTLPLPEESPSRLKVVKASEEVSPLVQVREDAKALAQAFMQANPNTSPTPEESPSRLKVVKTSRLKIVKG